MPALRSYLLGSGAPDPKISTNEVEGDDEAHEGDEDKGYLEHVFSPELVVGAGETSNT